MSAPSAPIHPTVALPERQDGWTLPQAYFSSPEIYRLDLDRIWRRGWLFVGHSCELRRAGDYLRVDVDVDSILVIRGDGGRIHAVHNVCRHRGSLLCDDPCGHVSKLVCPYHQWAYGLDGRLLAWRGMQADLRREDFGLLTVPVEEVGGILFIHIGSEPRPFDAARTCLEPLLAPQGFQRAKVAKRVDYTVNANWKVVWENNRECY
ncbi:MAG: aromatic ring-hydroxylating oxygenase subunit alpha, partial [Verrucomicrobiota bacterium]